MKTVKTSFFDQFTNEQMLQGHRNSLTGLIKCRDRSLKTGKYNGQTTAQWNKSVEKYEAIINELCVS